jgi:hypothetical protein
MPATAHWAYFSMQRALYDKGSAQGKQPEKRAKRLGTAEGVRWRCAIAKWRPSRDGRCRTT